MNLEQPRQPNGSDPEPALVIIDERPSDGLLGLFSHPVQPGGIVYLATVLPETELDFTEDSPLEGPNPRPIPEQGIAVSVLTDADAKTYRCHLESEDILIQELQLQVSTNGLESNGFSVLSDSLVSVRVTGSLDAGHLTVRFLNVSRSNVCLEIEPVGQPSEIISVKAGSKESHILTPDANTGKVAEIRLLGNPRPEETGGTEQADIYIEP